MDLHKAFDCTIGGCAFVVGFLNYGSLAHFEVIGGAILVAWRLVQAFFLEPRGIYWPRPRQWKRRR